MAHNIKTMLLHFIGIHFSVRVVQRLMFMTDRTGIL